jgi:hypothetical protein
MRQKPEIFQARVLPRHTATLRHGFRATPVIPTLKSALGADMIGAQGTRTVGHLRRKSASGPLYLEVFLRLFPISCDS